MSLADDLVRLVADRMAHADMPRTDAAEDRQRAEQYLGEARGVVAAVLRVLVDKHFPDDDVDYYYATEGLAQDACDALRELDAASAVERGKGQG